MRQPSWLVRFAIVAITVCAGPRPTASAAGKLLRLHLPAGETWVTRFHQRVDAQATIDGQPADQPVVTFNEQTIESAQTSAAADAPDQVRIEQRFTRFALKQKLAQGPELEFDTAEGKPGEGLLAQVGPAYQALLKARLGYVLGPRGDVVESNARDQLLAALAEDPENLAMLKSIFTDEALQQYGGTGGFAFPEEPVDLDETWEVAREIAMPIAGPQQTVFHYRYLGTVTSQGQTYDRLAFTVDLDFAPDPGLPYDLKLVEHQLQGQIDLDPTTGRTLRVEQTQTGVFDITVGDKHARQQFTTVTKVTSLPPGAEEKPTAGPAPRNPG